MVTEIPHSVTAQNSRYAELDLLWLLSKYTCSYSSPVDAQPIASDDAESDTDTLKDTCYVPTWSAFNSIFDEGKHPLTRVCVLPIVCMYVCMYICMYLKFDIASLLKFLSNAFESVQSRLIV